MASTTSTRARWQSRLRTGLATGRLLPLYLTFAVLKHVLPLRALAKLAWRAPRGAANALGERDTVARVIRAVNLLGWTDRDCLQRSLLLYRLLSEIGRDPMLMIGLQKDGSTTRGHAWVTTDGHVVGEPASHVARYVPFCGFGRYGQCTTAISA